ncbi:MAG: hypothetical protein V9E94_16995 [Microthrixaceae bacterium]
MQRTRSRLALAVAILSVMGLAAACAPSAPSSQSWTFRANSVTVNDSQDEVRGLFGECIPLEVLNGCKDEPYTLNIGFRVKIGAAGSASTEVVNNRTDAPENIPAGSTVTLTGNQQNAITWNNIKPLDVVDLASSSNKLEVVGVYSWASEEDFVGNGLAADSVANILEDALNSTLAAGTLPNDVNDILAMILDHIGDALGVLVQNIPLLGLGDDVLGGALYLGIGAKGGLADIINDATASTPPITLAIPLVELPPDIVGGGFFTFKNSTNFTQSFSGAGGQHTYNFGVSRN